MDKEDKLSLIILIITYAYLKEKYKEFENKLINKNKVDIEKIESFLQPLEEYIVIPDKKNLIENIYTELSGIFNSNIVNKEKSFLEKVNQLSLNLNKEDKKDVLNILMYVTDEDGKISHVEKTIILQLSNIWELENDFESLVSSYKKSKYKRSISLKKIFFIFFIILCVVISSIYFLYEYQTNNIKIFNEKRIAFKKISFNRFFIYSNKFQSGADKYFRKQAVFYIDGVAEVGFETKNLKYNPLTKTVSYTLPVKSPFSIKMKINSSQLIDKFKPQKISSSDAAKISGVVGLLGGLYSAKVTMGSSFVSKLYSTKAKSIAVSAVGLISGVVAGGFTYSILNNKYLNKEISISEEENVVSEAKNLIHKTLMYDNALTKMYKENFEKYIKSKYMSYGFDVQKIEYNMELLQ